MIKIYTNIDLLTEKYRSQVFPLLFDLCFASESSLTKCYKIEENFQESDIAVWPLEYAFSRKYFRKHLTKFISNARHANKLIWIYSGGDFGNSLNDDNIYNFRLSGFKTKLNENTIILPSFVSDPYHKHLKGTFVPISKEPLAKIGFVGHAKGGHLKFVKELLIFH